MSDTENRKSMDDVLASIRRIVRADKEPVDSEPEAPAAEAGEEPLALTPEMLRDGATDDAAGEESQPVSSPPETPASAVGAAIAGAQAEAAVSGAIRDVDDIKSLVRDVLLEELRGDKAGEIVRSVLRDELVSGETGGNISQNVLRLIQSEVAKSLRN